MKKLILVLYFLLIPLVGWAGELTLAWEKPIDGGKVEGYYLLYWQQADESDIKEVQILGEDNLDITIPTNFILTGDVWFVVVAYNTKLSDGSEQRGGRSNIVQWFRDNDAPGTPSGCYIVSVTL